ncbi:MAG: hypothetical protein QXR34_10600 [Saccharolobus sp.]
MEKRKLSGKDYALWVISVLAFFAFFLWVGEHIEQQGESLVYSWEV